MKKSIILVTTIFLFLNLGGSSIVQGQSGHTDDVVADNDTMNTVNEKGEIVPIDTTPGMETTINKGQRAKAAANGVLRLRVKPSINYTTVYTDQYGMSGYINGYYGGDAVYLGMVNNKAKFMMSGIIGYMDEYASDGTKNYEIYSFSDAKSISSYFVDNNYLYHKVASDVAVNNSFISSTRVGLKPTSLSSGVTYYSYDGHYFYLNYSTMINDYNKGIRTSAVNANNPNYNYYEFLSARSKTTLTASQINNYINTQTNSGVMLNTAQAFINAQNNNGVNAQLMIAHAALESGWGKSDYAVNRNNLFGIGAKDSNPGDASTFSSVNDCVERYANYYMSINYLDPKDVSGYYQGASYGDKNSGILKKWASDPYGGEKVGAVALSIDVYNGLVDINHYSIGIKEDSGVLNIRKEPSLSSNVLYSTLTYESIPFIILDSTNGWYKIQSDAPLNSNRTAIEQDKGTYDYNRSYAYVSSNYVKQINTVKQTIGWVNTPEGWVYVDNNGKRLIGWQSVNDHFYYFNPTNGVITIGWYRDVNGYHYFNEKGWMLTGWKEVEGHWYYFDETSGDKFGVIKTGWFRNENGYHYFNEKGWMLTGWQQVDDHMYYFNETPGTKLGVITIGWYRDVNGYHYFNEKGWMLTGWKEVEGHWYYFDETSGDKFGVIKTGWFRNENGYHYFNEKGWMLTGWKEVEGHWYYFNETKGQRLGVITIGWYRNENGYHYFNEKGWMLTGWKVVEGHQYYFNENNGIKLGVITTGWYRNTNGSYYFNEKGWLVQ